MSKKVLIVGGVAGGASAATRLRRLDEHAEIILFERDEHISFANCGLPDAKGKHPFFGAVKVSNRKHLFHFMPVYEFQELLDNISPALRKRMQGKSCFNFEALDPPLLSELETLVAQGVKRYKVAGKL